MSGFAWSPDKLSSVCLWCENMERLAANTNESPNPFSLSWFVSSISDISTYMDGMRCLSLSSQGVTTYSVRQLLSMDKWFSVLLKWKCDPWKYQRPTHHHFLFLNQLLQQSLALNHLWRGLSLWFLKLRMDCRYHPGIVSLIQCIRRSHPLGKIIILRECLPHQSTLWDKGKHVW